MKNTFVLLILLTVNNWVIAQNIPLPLRWKSMLGDNPAYKMSSYNDQNWANAPSSFVQISQTVPEKTYSWYRLHFSLPNNLLQKDVVLLLGKIDDADETYLNGKLIGKSGSFPPEDATAWDLDRKYTVRKQLIQKHNVLAIKVYNGAGVGGISPENMHIVTLENYKKLLQHQLNNNHSYHQLTTSNGLIAAVYNAKTYTIEHIYPHIFALYDSGKQVLPFASTVKLQTKDKPIETKYLYNTHVIQVRYNKWIVHYFAPFTTQEKIMYAVIQGTSAKVKNVHFSIQKTTQQLIVDSVIKTEKNLTTKYYMFSFNDSLENNTKSLQLAHKRLETKPSSLLALEVKWMQDVFKSCTIPKGLDINQKNAIEQSIAVLKMSQVGDSDIFPLSHGQILASLRPGVWAISWVRDACFTIEAMSKIGMFKEARKGLEFMLRASPTNQYKHYIHQDGKDYGVGKDYRISVTRYFGNGREESDFENTIGPNIELDGFGLFLIAVDYYTQCSGDSSFFLQWNNILSKEVADVIMYNIDSTNIIRAESGPWEHHLPGRHYAFTSGVCAEGLKRFALLQKKYNIHTDYYFNAYKSLYKGIIHHFVINNKFLKGNAEEKKYSMHYYYDAATVELVANGLMSKTSFILSHINTYNKILRAKGQGLYKGYMRFNSANNYENQEWPFATMRVAVALCKAGKKSIAKKLVQRITHLANLNFNLIPEMYTIEESKYTGSIPMVGYGAGAYILAMLDCYQLK